MTRFRITSRVRVPRPERPAAAVDVVTTPEAAHASAESAVLALRGFAGQSVLFQAR